MPDGLPLILISAAILGYLLVWQDLTFRRRAQIMFVLGVASVSAAAVLAVQAALAQPAGGFAAPALLLAVGLFYLLRRAMKARYGWRLFGAAAGGGARPLG